MGELQLFMSFQPCHHSGGRVPNNKLAREVYTSDAMGVGGAGPTHKTSCSERLKEWYTNVLKPRGVELSLILADVYKATWEEELHPTETERKVYASKSSAAREGMRPASPPATASGDT